MKSLFTFACLFFGVIGTVPAQRICGTTDYKQALLRSNPSLNSIFQNIEKQIEAITHPANTRAMRDTTSNEIIHIPVVIHVLYKNDVENISDAQIQSQLDILNNDYNLLNADRANTPQPFKSIAGNARIQFCLARVDPRGRKTSGIERKYTSENYFTTDDGMKMVATGGTAAWDSKHYLNIWICKLSSRTLGYATPPGAAADMDGVVIAYDAFGTAGNLRPLFNKGRTATHEIGHWLGLIHVWGDNDCGDDLVNDTPTQSAYNFGCSTFPKLSKCSPNSNGDMFMNFMDFSDDACMNIFTIGQVRRMRALFAQNNLRNAFLASFACDSILATADPLTLTGAVSRPAISVDPIRVYPSPVQYSATIECKTATALTPKTMDLFNSVGMKVFTQKLLQEKTVLNLSVLVTGIYIVRIGEGGEKFTTRIIKQ
ncbi:MAG: hypothetical protein JWP81_376 [Ferruginibacter sp.]|nr:hypothetical protein [Ferruginibacter sp.]